MIFKNSPLPSKKRIVLIAHDNKKQALAAWCKAHKEKLVQHELCGTGTTGYLLEQSLNHPVKKYLSGPMGGDQQVGAKIAEGEIDLMIFFWDPFEPLPHDPDVKALLRIAAVWNIPVACNAASADFILNSKMLNEEYEREIPDYQTYIKERTQSK